MVNSFSEGLFFAGICFWFCVCFFAKVNFLCSSWLLKHIYIHIHSTYVQLCNKLYSLYIYFWFLYVFIYTHKYVGWLDVFWGGHLKFGVSVCVLHPFSPTELERGHVCLCDFYSFVTDDRVSPFVLGWWVLSNLPEIWAKSTFENARGNCGFGLKMGYPGPNTPKSHVCHVFLWHGRLIGHFTMFSHTQIWNLALN